MGSLKSGYFFIASTIAYYVIERWLNFLESLVPDFIPYLNFLDVIFIGLAGFGVYLIVREKTKKQPLSEEQKQLIASKISHSHALKKLYNRIVSVRAEKTKQDILIFTVSPPMMYDPNEDVLLKETRRRIQEYADTPMTPLDVVQEAPYALQHLEDKEYKNINKHWKKANKLLEKYNKNNDEQTKTKIDESLQAFRQELLTLVDRLNDGHIMKGKCGSCP